MLLIPGAVLGAIFGLLATIWWQHLQRHKGGTVARDNGEDLLLPRSGVAAASASASSRAEAVVTLNQIGAVPSPKERRGQSSWLDDLEPGEAFVLFGVTTLLLASAYAWARPWIESVYLAVGGLGLGVCFTLLLSSLVAGVLGGRRLVIVLVFAILVFGATAASPWIISAADYPYKEYSEVLRLVESRPLEVSSLYGSIGLFFLIYQLIGVALVGASAVMTAAVIGAAVVGVSAVLNESMAARLAGFRRRAVGLTIASAIVCAIGVWATSGALFRLTDRQNAYASDKQNPHVYEARVRGRARKRVIGFRMDEPGTVFVSLRSRGSTKWVATRSHPTEPGLNTVTVKLPRTQERAIVVIRLRARDLAHRPSELWTAKIRTPAIAPRSKKHG